MRNLFCVAFLLNDSFIVTIIYHEIERAIYVIGSALQLYNQKEGPPREWRDYALQQCKNEVQMVLL